VTGGGDGTGDYFVALSPHHERSGEVRAAPRRRRDRRGLLAAALAVVLLAAGWRVGLVSMGGVDGAGGLLAAAPPGAAQQRVARLLAAPPVPAQGTSYTFLRAGEGGPVAWSACEQVHVVFRPDGEVPGGRALLLDALAQLSAATGLSIVDDGSTTEAPADTRAAYQPDRYGPTWAPVLVAWSSPGESAELAGDVAAVAGPGSYAPAGRAERYVTGTVVLDAPQLAQVLAQPGGTAAARGVVLHELGHLVGLGHVEDATQVMHPRADGRSPTLYADSDLRGLALLGSQPCP
jgi:hypothetical protein